MQYGTLSDYYKPRALAEERIARILGKSAPKPIIEQSLPEIKPTLAATLYHKRYQYAYSQNPENRRKAVERAMKWKAEHRERARAGRMKRYWRKKEERMKAEAVSTHRLLSHGCL
jgi:hypothetical protein